ncbi:cation diffusion facilitator family transporter [Corynebacterium breve]|uniref:Cation diffusion facilitator family transporter n=1 Tax=Corynebacterium breve TaxID=3049799 RepID=A0ABY8VIF1_9CORY|nr:cation diffusion facilitator family transporter [Corynebacterium breve]WIM68530.1 cation diffusion facilitator family transporter [Corynebacterium breve]
MSHDHDHEHEHHSHDDLGVWGQIKHALTPHSHDAAEQILTAEESTQEGIKTAWISLLGMGATAAAQLIIVWISGSLALLADTIHNFGHLVTTIPLLMAFYLSRRKPTHQYPYGLKRIEDLAGLLVTLVVVLTIVLIVVESLMALASPPELSHLGWVFAAGLVGFLGNEIVAIYRIRTGQRIGSAALIAEGQHARADGLTSIAVVLGVVGVWLGFERADAVAGLLIAAVITGTMFNSLRIVIRRILDGVDSELMEAMHHAVEHVPGIVAVERVRARWLGHRMEADVLVTVAGSSTAREIQSVTDKINSALREKAANLDVITVQVNPAT